jgi:4-amino-4-deoxy-L-arabinose transferase-like glycosyltransferase
MSVRTLARRLVRGPDRVPRWARPLLLALLAVTAGLYLWDLGASGWANAYYSGAVQAMTESWKAFFFGSFDSANFITVDKTPASLWVMAISARIFGVNAWSILVPQALAGVASVGLLYAAVSRWAGAAAGRRADASGPVARWAGPAAGLIAGAALALTPVAALMFRFNNPDALLVLLMVGAAYATVRAVDSGRTWWLVGAGVLVGAGFMTKMLQAFLVVPALVLVYLVAGKPRLWKRLWQTALAGVAVVVSAGWWVAAVTLWPASSRPYIGGSQTNSILELTLGYNGLGRLTGDEVGSVGGGAAGQAGRWGITGITRLFQADWGGQIAWLIPAALVLGIACLVIAWRAPRTDRLRASVLLWGGWFVVTAAVFSYGAGIIHQYYAVALAPAIGALVGTGAVALWSRRERLWSRLLLAATLAGSCVWAFVLLERSADWLPPLRYAVLAGGVVAALLIAVAPLGRRPLRVAVVTAGLAVLLAGPAACAVDTVLTPHTGSIPLAGPTVAGASGMGGPGGQGGVPGGQPPAFATQQDGQDGVPAMPASFEGSAGGAPAAPGGQVATGAQSDGQDGRGAPGGGLGGLLEASTPSAELVTLLQTDADRYTWVAASVGANSAAGVQLAAAEPVMAIGGFNGSDPWPTLEGFKKLVAAGEIHYFLSGGMGGGPGGGSGTSSEITSWVTSTFSSSTVGGVTVYDLTTRA